MERLGKNLRARARELGLTDSEVARRLHLSQARYAHYVTGAREPDFMTFERICSVLATTPDALLGYRPKADARTEQGKLVKRIEAAANAMDLNQLRVAAAVMDAIAEERAAAKRRR